VYCVTRCDRQHLCAMQSKGHFACVCIGNLYPYLWSGTQEKDNATLIQNSLCMPLQTPPVCHRFAFCLTSSGYHCRISTACGWCCWWAAKPMSENSLHERRSIDGGACLHGGKSGHKRQTQSWGGWPEPKRKGCNSPTPFQPLGGRR
jgi:hypothetical protein